MPTLYAPGPGLGEPKERIETSLHIGMACRYTFRLANSDRLRFPSRTF